MNDCIEFSRLWHNQLAGIIIQIYVRLGLVRLIHINNCFQTKKKKTKLNTAMAHEETASPNKNCRSTCSMNFNCFEWRKGWVQTFFSLLLFFLLCERWTVGLIYQYIWRIQSLFFSLFLLLILLFLLLRKSLFSFSGGKSFALAKHFCENFNYWCLMKTHRFG